MKSKKILKILREKFNEQKLNRIDYFYNNLKQELLSELTQYIDRDKIKENEYEGL